jgi:AmmeMemoRadiSam system protein B
MKKYIVQILTSVAICLIVIWLLHSPKEDKNIAGMIVPHHDLVAAQRMEFFTEVSKNLSSDKSPETIILVSPNHYFSGQGDIQTTDQVWKLTGSEILPNTEVIADLINSGMVTKQPVTFVDEHGIYSVLADIKQNFPQAKIVPLVLKQNRMESLTRLASLLNESCRKCLMISSVDFSHYQPAELAELHDDKTIRDLTTLNTKSLLTDVEVDSGASLTLLTLWSKLHNSESFQLYNHTNSSLLFNNPDLEGTSHIYGWYQSGRKIQPLPFKTFIISESESFGIENRTIWGTDFLLKDEYPNIDSSKFFIAGKIYQQRIDFFAVPIDHDDSKKLAIGEQKQKALNNFYLPYEKYVVSSPAGKYVSIPFSQNLDITRLSSQAAGNIIKSYINQNYEHSK